MAHHKPNSFCDNPNQWPTAGNKNKATEFKINITPKATEVCFSSDFITGAMAAMALPPQMAVPQEIRCEVFFSIFNHFPKNVPKINVLKIDAIVKKKPSFPAEKALVTFIPKPKPMTETCNRIFVALWLRLKKGCPEKLATINPNSKAIGGETKEVKQNKINTTKIICWSLEFILKKNKVSF